MGILGGIFGKIAGKQAGQALGGLIGGKKARHEGGKIGETIGTVAGTEFIPYKNGGRVKKTGPALVHKDEIVLPKGVKATASQKKAIRARGGKL